MIELPPNEPLVCPFCGSPDCRNEAWSSRERQGYAVSCFSCLARGPIKPSPGNSAVAWNRFNNPPKEASP